MKKILPLVFCLMSVSLTAAEPSVVDAVRQADDARTAALIAGDRARLAEILSDELRYSHASGTVHDKAAYIAAETAGHTVFKSFDYEQREFKPVGEGVVLMYGRVRIEEATAGKPVHHHLNFLAVWRREGGAWRFLSWQSCELPPAKG